MRLERKLETFFSFVEMQILSSSCAWLKSESPCLLLHLPFEGNEKNDLRPWGIMKDTRKETAVNLEIQMRGGEGDLSPWWHVCLCAKVLTPTSPCLQRKKVVVVKWDLTSRVFGLSHARQQDKQYGHFDMHGRVSSSVMTTQSGSDSLKMMILLLQSIVIFPGPHGLLQDEMSKQQLKTFLQLQTSVLR